ncbi:MAG: BLUF domain-containing protein, partial [Thermomonas sp.]
MTQLIAVSYSSVATRAMTPADLDALLFGAQAFNHAQGVTGALCYDKGVFIQYFEGSSDAVERVYARIRASSL